MVAYAIKQLARVATAYVVWTQSLSQEVQWTLNESDARKFKTQIQAYRYAQQLGLVDFEVVTITINQGRGEERLEVFLR